MHNPENEMTSTVSTTITATNERISPFWPAVLARFTAISSVERLIRKKERELEPDELARFIEAAIRRLEELSENEG
jgi:hypothetical protein